MNQIKDPIDSLAHLDPEPEEIEMPAKHKNTRRSHSGFNTMGIPPHEATRPVKRMPELPEALRHPTKPPGRKA
jgi:hypothetical protein